MTVTSHSTGGGTIACIGWCESISGCSGVCVSDDHCSSGWDMHAGWSIAIIVIVMVIIMVVSGSILGVQFEFLFKSSERAEHFIFG